MRMKTKRVSDETMRDWINAWFQRRKCKEESISYLVQSIREDGMSFPNASLVCNGRVRAAGL